MKQANENNDICSFGLTTSSIYIPVLSVGLLFLMVGCDKSHNPDNKAIVMNSKNKLISEKTRKDLMNIKGKRIYFMHHSVGKNILSGLKTLSSESGVSLNIVYLKNQPTSSEKVFVSTTGGKNTQPKSKIDSFTTQIKELNNDMVPDIAFMKFCYVDFNPNTNVNEIFSYYKQKMETLKNERRNIKFAHLTVPLTARTNSIKDRINRFLGRQVWGDTSNVKRAEFNKLLLEAFSQDPIFDIARIESTFPNGSRSSFVQNGKTYYSLVTDYTYDGGHLNTIGQRHAAIKIAQFLAEIPKTKLK